MKKVLSTLLLLMAFCVPWVTQAQSTEELTVADGTITNSYVPVYGTYCDDFLRTQIIYPADDLADMINGTISQLTFYLYSSASEAWTSSFQVNLSEVAQTSFASPNFLTTSSVGVYSGTLDATGSTMTITFSTPYVYQGGNLLLDIYSLTDGNYKTATFTGQTVNGASITGYNSSGVSSISNTAQRNFMPKTTFTYVPGVVSCVRPSAITIDNLTSNSASFSWTAGGSETSWIATLRDGENSQSFILNTPSYVANGTLTPNTQYSFSVRSICSAGDTSVPRTVGFRTECGMLTLPFFTDFESETTGGASISSYPNFILCWNRLNDASSASYQGYPYVTSSSTAGYAHSGTKYLMMYSSGTNTSYPDNVIAVLPQLDVTVNPVNSLRLKFWARPGSSNLVPDLTVGVMSDPTDASTFVPVQTVNVQSISMTEFVVSLQGYEGTGSYVALKSVRNGSGNMAIYVDDITLEPMPTCLDPSLLVVNYATVTNNSCQLSWQNGASETQWNVRYKAEGESDWTELSAPITTNPYTLTGLTPSTTYSIQVRAYCSATDQSPWSNTTVVTTRCDAVAIPFAEDFNTLTSGIPTCWSNAEGTTNTASYKWNYYATGYDGKGVRFNSYANNEGAINVLATPMITLSSHSILSFMAKNPAGGDFCVMIGAAGSATRDTLVSNITGVADWTLFDADLNAYTGQAVIIYFCGTSNHGSTGAYLDLDNVSVMEAPSCISPNNVSFDSITAYTVSVAWNVRGTETAWELRYKKAVDTTWTEITSNITNPYTLTGLEMNTYYDVQVRAYCSAEDQSDWTFTQTVLTGCDIVSTLPWVEDFEQVATGSSSSPAPNCWDMTDMNDGMAPYCYVSSTTYSQSGGKCLLFSTMNNAPYGYVALPPFEAPTNTLRVTFSYRSGNLTTAGLFSIGYMTDVTDGSTFIPVQEDFVRCTTYTTHTVYFDEVPPRGNSRIAFRFGDGTSSSTNNSYVDDITVELIPSCADPSGLTVESVSSTGATLSWTSNGSETAWNVRYKESSETTWTELDAPVTTNPYTLSGLTDNTVYDVQVRAYCSADDQSPWTSVVSFRTACLEVTSFPWSEEFEDFDANIVPFCWDNSGSTTPAVSGTNPHYVWGVYEYGGNKMLRMYNYLVNAGNALINTPIITLPQSGIYQLAFDYSHRSSSGDLLVKVSTDLGTTFTNLLTLSSSGQGMDYTDPGTFTTQEISLADYAGQSVMFQFFNVANYGSGALFIDNISVDIVPTCLKPTDVVISDITTSSASIGWTAVGDATSWNIRYKEASDTVWTELAAPVTTNPYALSGLTANTAYDVQVRSYCSESDQSPWTRSFSFRTNCLDITTFPWNENFDDMSANIVPPCWDNSGSTTSDVVSNPAYVWGVYEYQGNKMLRMYNYLVHTGAALINTPVITLPETGSYELSFDYSHRSSSGDLLVKVSTDLGVTFTTLLTLPQGSQGTDYTIPGTFTNQEISLEDYAGQSVMFQFFNSANYGNGALFLDNINIQSSSTDPDPVVYDTMYVSYYEKTYYAADNDWYYELYTESDTSFYFDIVADSIISGQTYTLSNMLSNYSGMAVGMSFNGFSAATFTYTADQTLMRENIVATGTVNGTNYMIIYDAEIDTGMHYDNRDSDFVRNYTLAEAELDDDYFTTYGVVELSVTASDLSSAVAIEFNVSSLDADITVPEGVYTINTSNLAGTVVASPGVVGSSVYPSYAANIEGGYLATPLWFMENGTVTVRKVNGLFTALVEATNSYGRNIHILIGDTNAVVVPDSVTFVVSVNDTAMGTVNPMGTVRYAVGDTVTATATANEGYHFVDWTVTVWDFTIPMTENPLSYVALDDFANSTITVVANFVSDSVPPTPVVYDTVYVSYYEKYGIGSNRWSYDLYNPESDTTFSFEIVADSIVYGHTYTLADMFFGFSRMYVGLTPVDYSAASFIHTRNEATQRENITAVVTLTTGQGYVVIYDAEIDTGLRYDTRDSDFVHNYTLAEAELDDDNFSTYGVVDLFVLASDSSSAVSIEFNVASLDADITIPEGVYTINTSNLAGTVVASQGVISSRVYPSYVAGVYGNYLSEPFWFMENGTVTVRKVNGLFTALVEATNSYGRNIHILVGDTNSVVAPDSVTFVVSVNDAAMGTVNPMGTVRYAVGDSVTATATANEGYHFVDWTMTVMGMPIPMTENPLSYVIPAIIANQTVNVVANFAADSVPPAADSVTINISVNDPAMGTVDPMGTVRYAVGETVSATATANDGYHFVNWSISVTGMTIPMTENPLTYEIPAFIPAMAADMTVDVVANFAPDSVPPAADSVTINIAVNDPAMGTVDPIGTVRYAVGETVSATATANDGYHFVNWSISVMGMPVPIPMTENPLAYTIPAMAANMTVDVTANFEADSIGISQFNTSTPQQINIYPNPANSVANVKVSGVNGKVNVAVLDMNGRVVMNDSMECDGEAVKSLNIESLAQGAYFVRIYGEDFNSIQKLIVR